jgi:voltage-gated potassium channel Kch
MGHVGNRGIVLTGGISGGSWHFRGMRMQKLYRVYRYALFLLDRFKYLVLAALVVLVVATSVLYFFHPEQGNPATERGLGEVAFGVFELMFASEPALPYPKGSLAAQIVFFALPVLNILGLAAALAQFSAILFDPGLYNRAQADSADDHVIVCGLGRLGREVLKQLDRRHHLKNRRDIVIVENGSGVDAVDDDLITREPIIPVVHGNMTHAATLRDAGIHRAAAVMLLTGNDTTNLEAALLARELNPGVRVVLRMSNSRVSQRLDAMLRRSLIRNFQLIDSVEGSAPKCLDLCRIVTDHEPTCSITAAAADPARAAGHVVVCGLGRLGFGIVRQLKGHAPMIVIDHGERPHYADEPVMTADPAVPLIRGDMTIKRTLLEAGVDRAAAVLLLTPDDTQNLEAAMVAHELNPGAWIVLRITNSRIAGRLDRVLREAFGERLRVIDPSEHAAPRFVEALWIDQQHRAAGAVAAAVIGALTGSSGAPARTAQTAPTRA